MELSFLLVNPLPSRLAFSKAIKFEGDILQPGPSRCLMSITATSKDDTLVTAEIFHFEF